MNLVELKAHAFEAIQNRDLWQNELNATIQAIKDYKEPKKEAEKTEIDEK